MTEIYKQDWTNVPEMVKVKTLTGKKLISKKNTKFTMLCRITPKLIDDLVEIIDKMNWDMDRQTTYLHGKYKTSSRNNIKKLQADIAKTMTIIEYVRYIDKKFPACKSNIYVVKDEIGTILVASLDLAIDIFDIGGVINESCNN